MKIFKDFIYFIFSLQEKMLYKKLSKTIGVKNGSKRKKFYTSGCMLSLDNLADSEKQKMEEDITDILKSVNFDPNNILNYIKLKGTKISYIENEKALNSIGENAGFIYPQKGPKAIALSLLLGEGFKTECEEQFILTKGELNTYYFIYHFYNWYAYKHGISGIDSNSQKLLNKYLFCADDEEISKLQLADIYKLKDAIKQDKSAIEFVFKLCQASEGAKKALEKLKNEGTQI